MCDRSNHAAVCSNCSLQVINSQNKIKIQGLSHQFVCRLLAKIVADSVSFFLYSSSWNHQENNFTDPTTIIAQNLWEKQGDIRAKRILHGEFHCPLLHLNQTLNQHLLHHPHLRSTHKMQRVPKQLLKYGKKKMHKEISFWSLHLNLIHHPWLPVIRGTRELV